MTFYILASEQIQPSNKQYRGKWCDAWAVDGKYGSFEKCPLCGKAVSMKKWEEPRKVRLTSTKYPDRLQAWLSDSFVVSERFMRAYSDSDLIGISSFSGIEVVKVAHKKAGNVLLPNYFYASIGFSKTVRIDTNKTIYHGQKTDWICPVCNPFGSTKDSIERLALDASQWDGTDIFRIYDSGSYFCSEKFYEFIKFNGFTNFFPVPVDEYTWRLKA